MALGNHDERPQPAPIVERHERRRLRRPSEHLGPPCEIGRVRQPPASPRQTPHSRRSCHAQNMRRHPAEHAAVAMRETRTRVRRRTPPAPPTPPRRPSRCCGLRSVVGMRGAVGAGCCGVVGGGSRGLMLLEVAVLGVVGRVEVEVAGGWLTLRVPLTVSKVVGSPAFGRQPSVGSRHVWVGSGGCPPVPKRIRSDPAPPAVTNRPRRRHVTAPTTPRIETPPRGPPHPGTLSRRTRRHRPPGCDTPEPNHQHQPPPTNEPQPPRNTPRQHPDNETNPRRPTERSEVLLGLPPGVAGTFVPAVADARSVVVVVAGGSVKTLVR